MILLTRDCQIPLAFALYLAAGFVNPAEHHGDPQRTYIPYGCIKGIYAYNLTGSESPTGSRSKER